MIGKGLTWGWEGGGGVLLTNLGREGLRGEGGYRIINWIDICDQEGGGQRQEAKGRYKRNKKNSFVILNNEINLLLIITPIKNENII